LLWAPPRHSCFSLVLRRWPCDHAPGPQGLSRLFSPASQSLHAGSPDLLENPGIPAPPRGLSLASQVQRRPNATGRVLHAGSSTALHKALFIFTFFSTSGDRTQGLAQASQLLYPLTSLYKNIFKMLTPVILATQEAEIWRIVV
jgi:hypothetical protein